MKVKNTIQSKLIKAFSPSVLEVINESHMHSVPAHSETHFRVVIVSEQFAGTSTIERHRQVHQALAQEMKNGVHALVIVAKTKAEWERNKSTSPSPLCVNQTKGDL